jgi:hypothetical protein
VQHKTPKGWRVLRHVNYLTLCNISYVVSQAGRARTLREGKKYVHAYIEGEIETIDANSEDLGRQLTYNPRLSDKFLWTPSGQPADAGIRVLLGRFGVFELKEKVNHDSK